MHDSPLVWREDLLVSFAAIDQQHRDVVARASELHAALGANYPDSEIDRMISVLIETTRHHFTAEEGLMLASGYPLYEAHRAEHRRLLDQLAAMRNDLAAGYLAASKAVELFVRIWTEQHMIFSDKPLGDYLNRAGFPGGS